MAQCGVSLLPAKKAKRKPTGLIIPAGLPEPEESHGCRHIQQVLPDLFVSDYAATKDLVEMRKRGITHVLNLVGERKCPPAHEHEMEYTCMLMPDNPRVDITFFVYEALELVDRVIASGGKVLVHCVQGISRAPTIACAYLMWKHQLSLTSSLDQVRLLHPGADPNIGFLSQLDRLRSGDSIDTVYSYSAKYQMFVSGETGEGRVVRRGSEVYGELPKQTGETEERVRRALELVQRFEPRTRVVLVEGQ